MEGLMNKVNGGRKRKEEEKKLRVKYVKKKVKEIGKG